MKVIDKLRVPANYDCINCKHLSTKDYIGCKQHYHIRANILKKYETSFKTYKNNTIYYNSIPVQKIINDDFVLCEEYEYEHNR